MKYTGIEKPDNVDDTMHCPLCGYTEWDSMVQMDHYLCKGTIPLATPVEGGSRE